MPSIIGRLRMTPRLLDYCRAHHDWLLDLIQALVRIESPTDDKAAVDRCGAVLARGCAAIGASVTRVPQSRRRAITCWRELRHRAAAGPAPRPLRHRVADRPARAHAASAQEDGRLHGPGILDMKAGIGLGMLATRAAARSWRRRPRSASRCCGPRTRRSAAPRSRALIEDEARKSDAVLVLEPALAGGALKTARKGVGQFELTVHGVSAHAGRRPPQGRQRHARAGAADPRHRRDPRPRARHLGQRRGRVGRHARRTSCPSPRTAIGRRAVRDAGRRGRVDRSMRALARRRLPGARLEVTGGFNRPPMERSPGVVRAVRDGARLRSRDWAWTSRRARPAAGRTATSPPRSASRRSTGSAPSATAPTRCTST